MRLFRNLAFLDSTRVECHNDWITDCQSVNVSLSIKDRIGQGALMSLLPIIGRRETGHNGFRTQKLYHHPGSPTSFKFYYRTPGKEPCFRLNYLHCGHFSILFTAAHTHTARLYIGRSPHSTRVKCNVLVRGNLP